MPAGLSVNTVTGLISGTPTTAGTAPVTLSATNSGGTGTATLTLTIVSEVLDQVPQLAAIHPWLPSHHWLAWVDVLRDPIRTSAMR